MNLAPRAGGKPATDVIIIGDGVIGLSIALEFARRGVSCRVLGASRRGSASGAAAGLLAPSLGKLSNAVRPFFYGSLARFPSYLHSLREVDPTLRIIEGVIEVTQVVEQRFPPSYAAPIVLSPADVAEIEPALAGQGPVVLHPRDGAIDNVRLLAALRTAAAQHTKVIFGADDPAQRLTIGADCEVETAVGGRFRAGHVVLAAGAWLPALHGLPRPLPVAPLKGQMIALRATPLRHPVMGAGVYLVPRGAETVIGATTERAGFDVTTDGRTVATLMASAATVCPSLGWAALDRAWAGIRPASPDMLPILGPDADERRVVYACGHSKNGILLAPATAELIVAGVTGEQTELDGLPFRIDRFPAETTR